MAHPVDAGRPVGGFLDGRAGHDDAVAGQDHGGLVADDVGQGGAQLGVVDLTGVLGDEGQVCVEHASGLVDDFGEYTHGGQYGDVVGMVVDDDPGVGAAAVQFGVDVDGGRDIPLAFQHVAVGIDPADVGGLDLLPPQAPRVDPHVTARVRLPGEVHADRRCDPRCPFGQSAFAYLGWFAVRCLGHALYLSSSRRRPRAGRIRCYDHGRQANN